MIRGIGRSYPFFIGFLVVALILLSAVHEAQAQKVERTATNAHSKTVSEQPLYSDYKGVRIGMTAEEARAKLGAPTIKADDMDFYTFSDRETAQIAYDQAGKVKTISVDYLGGVGAPDPANVVGSDLEIRNGSQYKLVRYEALGFWVSYNRSGGPVVVVTITIQKA